MVRQVLEKSTVAKMLAKRLGFRYLDTGAMYRALTWKAVQKGVNLEDENALCQLIDGTTIEFRGKDENLNIFVDGYNVTKEIRLPSITNNIHYISNKLGVRQRMVKLQQKLAAEGNIVAEGRDMGTVVFPNAERKFFWTQILKNAPKDVTLSLSRRIKKFFMLML